MKFLIALAALVVVCAARPNLLTVAPIAPIAPVLSEVPETSQYHSQDAIGQYSFGYKTPLSSRSEVQGFDKVTHGTYSYVDPNNVLQTVNYKSDPISGFQVAATNLPKSNERLTVPEVFPVVEPIAKVAPVVAPIAPIAPIAEVPIVKSVVEPLPLHNLPYVAPTILERKAYLDPYVAPHMYSAAYPYYGYSAFRSYPYIY